MKTGKILSRTVRWVLGFGLASSSIVACSGDRFEGCGQATCPVPSESGGQAGAPEVARGDGEGATSSGSGGSGGEAGASSEGHASRCAGCAEEACCGNACVDLDSDSNHCGKCGHACALDGVVPACVAGQCEFEHCEEGRLDCNADLGDGCEERDPGTPERVVLTQPKFGAYTGSLHAREDFATLRPHFGWEPVEAACGMLGYQLQIDDECAVTDFESCSFPSPEVDVSGLEATEWQPVDDLPVEQSAPPLGTRYYWRVRACDGLRRCSDWSEVRYLDVGRLKQDLDGDGYADIVGLTADALWFWRGRGDMGGWPLPVSEAGYRSYSGDFDPVGAEWFRVRFLGDVNGDGFADLGAPSSGVRVLDGVTTRAFLLFEGMADIAEMEPIILPSPRDMEGVPAFMPAGDFDHDGFADFLLGIGQNSGDRSWLAFYRGGASLDATASYEHLWEAPDDRDDFGFAHAVSSGDYNGDGYSDLAITLERDHEVRLVLGGAAVDFDADAQFPYGVAGVECIPSAIDTLDMNGDGFDDIALLCNSASQLDVFFGASMPPAEVAWSASLPHVSDTCAAGDVNGDGFDDVFVSGPVLYAGGSSPDVVPHSIWMVDDTGEAKQPLAVADHNGDGYLDAVLMNYWAAGSANLTANRIAQLDAGSATLRTFAR